MNRYFTKREVIAGLSSFFTLAYLLLLYPQIMSEGGFDFGATLVAQIITLAASSIFLALYAGFPGVIAPGLSVVAYLVYSAIQKQGVLPSQALGIVFWSGLFVFLLSVFKIRQKILLHLPNAIKYSAIAGIGLFLICIGLKNLSLLFPMNTESLFSPPTAIAAAGLLLFYLLYRRKIDSAFILTILSCWFLGIIFGQAHWKGFAALPPSISPSLLSLDLSVILQPPLWGALLSVLLISLFDSSASLTALARLNHQITPQGKIERVDQIVIPDGLGSMLAGLLGATSLSFTLESSSGIKAGGRTGATSIVASAACLIGLFLFPLLSSIPLFATTPALIAIGFFMAREIKEISWRDWTEAVPALLTLLAIPLTFSIYLGFAAGFVSYAAIKALTGKFKEVHPLCWGLALIFAAHLIWTYKL
jgi:AGZA family xanthine/uracil permease-like MFS transporter